jgi:hypothetical protein
VEEAESGDTASVSNPAERVHTFSVEKYLENRESGFRDRDRGFQAVRSHRINQHPIQFHQFQNGLDTRRINNYRVPFIVLIPVYSFNHHIRRRRDIGCSCSCSCSCSLFSEAFLNLSDDQRIDMGGWVDIRHISRRALLALTPRFFCGRSYVHCSPKSKHG